MMLYDIPYPGNAAAIKQQGLGHGPHQLPGLALSFRDRAGGQRPEENDITGDSAFLEKLDPKFVANDLVNYTFIKKALDANPKWKNDHSVPKSGDPFTRTETIDPMSNAATSGAAMPPPV
jgi:hypothetical protein